MKKAILSSALLTLIFSNPTLGANSKQAGENFNLPKGIQVDVVTPGFVHVPRRRKDVADAPVPIQVIARLTNKTKNTVSWTVKPSQVHYWTLTGPDGETIESPHEIKYSEQGLSGLTVSIEPNKSVESRDLITVLHDSLKPGKTYKIGYTYWGFAGASDFRAVCIADLVK